MNSTRIITIICWLVTALVLIGLVIWFLTGSLFGINTGFKINMPVFHIGSLETLTGPFNEAGTYTVEADGVESIHVDWVSGEVRITPYDGSDIKITEYAQRELNDNEKLACGMDGDTLKIKYVSTPVTFSMLTKKVEVLVPESLAGELDQLKVESTSAELEINGFTVKTLTIDETSGTSDISNIRADSVSVDSVSGEINISALQTTKLTIGEVSGDIMLSDVSADTVITDSTSGTQQLGGTFRSLDLDSVSGDITIISAINPDNIRCDTTSGSIRLTIPGKDDLAVSYSTVSGDFTSEVPVITGGGSSDYHFSTVSGDMKILANY